MDDNKEKWQVVQEEIQEKLNEMNDNSTEENLDDLIEEYVEKPIPVLVTGGTGFFGKHVCEELKKNNYKPVVFHRNQYNLLSYEEARAAIITSKAKHVIHLAAIQGGIKFNRDNPVSLLENNSLMALNIFKACKELNMEKLLYVLPSCSFPDGGSVIKENSLNEGKPNESVASHAYGKRLQNALSVAYRKQFGLNSVGVAVTNLYGPGANFHPENSKVVEATIRKVVSAVEEEKDNIEMWGSGKPKRQFMFVKDAARGLVNVFKEYDGEDIVNICCKEEVSIKELVDNVVGITDYDGKVIWNQQPDGQMRKMLEVSKNTNKFVGETTAFEEGLRETIDWFKEQ